MTAYRVPQRLAHVVSGDGPAPPNDDPALPDVVFLMPLPDGAPQVLHGSAAWIWLLAVAGESDVASSIAVLVGLGVDEVAAGVENFLVELVDRGLLEVGAHGEQ